MEKPAWQEKLLELAKEAEEGKRKDSLEAKKLPKQTESNLEKKFDLNEKAFMRLKELDRGETIKFSNIREKICTLFCITKRELIKLLERFEAEGKIEFVKQKGVRIVK